MLSALLHTLFELLLWGIAGVIWSVQELWHTLVRERKAR